ncbi:metallophosphoesterase [Candidatus Nomurabacteria bacterium]|nr:MAG: metallophosphoesterase [Candidatus Nomurabacteria bacterium]
MKKFLSIGITIIGCIFILAIFWLEVAFIFHKELSVLGSISIASIEFALVYIFEVSKFGNRWHFCEVYGRALFVTILFASLAAVFVSGILLSFVFLLSLTPFVVGSQLIMWAIGSGLMFGLVLFSVFMYGMLRGLAHISIKTIQIVDAKIPKAFNGFRFVQISDIHSGTYTSILPIKKAVALINTQQPDCVFFTGDLVNNRVEEVLPYILELKKLKAPSGIFSILGNHDYGDYVSWKTPEEKIANLLQLKKYQKELGWNLLLNEHVSIQKNDAQINLIGVENWSSKMHFTKYGDLAKATSDIDQNLFTILLSHDPSHFDKEVNTMYPWITLTLSGHTHGMQFGIETKQIKWSPIKYVYPHWAGLYHIGSQYLYVNRGLGALGFPGRVGMRPEITVFVLTSGY